MNDKREIALAHVENCAQSLHVSCEAFECDHGEYYEGDGFSILDVIAMLLRVSEPDGGEGKLELDRSIVSVEYDRDGLGVMKVACEARMAKEGHEDAD